MDNFMDQPFGLGGAGIKKAKAKLNNINHNKRLKSIQNGNSFMQDIFCQIGPSDRSLTPQQAAGVSELQYKDFPLPGRFIAPSRLVLFDKLKTQSMFMELVEDAGSFKPP